MSPRADRWVYDVEVLRAELATLPLPGNALPRTFADRRPGWELVRSARHRASSPAVFVLTYRRLRVEEDLDSEQPG